jgi:hypothetical protein
MVNGTALLSGSQQMQHGVGRTAHGDIDRHRVLERFHGGDAARQGTGIVLFVPATGQADDPPPGLQEQFAPVGMGRHQAAIARQRQAQRLGQAVHRIGGEHARARSAGRQADRSIDWDSASLTRGSAAETIDVTRSTCRSMPPSVIRRPPSGRPRRR